MIITPITINYNQWTVAAFKFIPEQDQFNGTAAYITHGYTSHKGSLLNWATRLCEEGAAVVLFDLPGHYLGSINEVRDFYKFTNSVHELFNCAQEELKPMAIKKTAFIGHSLGGLLAIKSLARFMGQDAVAIGVGLGVSDSFKDGKHLFQTPFYKSTLKIREQLVSPAIDPTKVFEWIANAKRNIDISSKKIHLICGQDDLVVGKNGAKAFMDLLNSKNNEVTLDQPKKLPHHQPELAASNIKKYLKDISYL